MKEEDEEERMNRRGVEKVEDVIVPHSKLHSKVPLLSKYLLKELDNIGT